MENDLTAPEGHIIIEQQFSIIIHNVYYFVIKEKLLAKLQKSRTHAMYILHCTCASERSLKFSRILTITNIIIGVRAMGLRGAAAPPPHRIVHIAISGLKIR